ncbi:asparagine synthase (glutamine-hydrolyzing) [Fodinisporobacter ferrooxydans]|uniref:asparagine synthase (glutamine-hydrolyzing) n=1 Tax=Fodinisporobacter ferrooxydans TaxID=2901836 RepID=A0ABY4CKZ0_9BACL|nr:asparagine synthase (glutamine-hydrolyzing) [Alicyclobacillaceae bacterium MYW30-H2]
MCGICGLMTKNNQAVDETTIIRMCDQIIHRGPDDHGVYLDHGVGLGFRRLSIIDLEGGHQPLSNEDGTVWIIFNGEIYNYQSLRRQLIDLGHTFKTEADTEVIVHLYEEKGPDCVRELRGMFAFAIWDSRNQQLFAARDYFGIKPFYYVETGDHFAFGSEIKSLLQVPGVKREVDAQSFWNYLTFQYVPEPDTMFRQIKKLPPAHRMVLKNGTLKIERYWEASFHPEPDKPLSFFVEGTRELLKESVKIHMNSDVPRGAFLSSGVDSSTVVALLRKMEQVKTFTVGFEGAGGMNEIEYARETARILGTEHRDVVISAETYREQLPRLAFYQDEPVADPSAIALYFVAELASKYITVVLSGEGADEIFGGYTIYREPLSLKMFDYMPPSMRRTLGSMAAYMPEGVKGRSFLMRGSKPVQERFVGNAFIFTDEEKRRFVKINADAPGFVKPFDITGNYYQRAASYDDVTKMQYVDIHTWLAGDILMKADKMTMANSLELRVPFLDKEIFEFAAKIPMQYRLMNNTTKFVLREAVKDILPKEVSTRKKLGFPVPMRKWLRNEFYDWAYQLIESSPIDSLIDKSYVLQLLEDHRKEVRDNSRKVWTILMFILWHQIYIEHSVHINPAPSPNIQVRRNYQQESVTV